MRRYTINLTRARAAGRKKRAKKAVSILREELERKEGEVILSREVNQEIWKNGASKPPAKITVEVDELDGEKHAKLPENRSQKDSKETGEDHSEVVSGTISEAKDAIEELDNPDFEELLEAEKKGKDRKTLKDWIETQM